MFYGKYGKETLSINYAIRLLLNSLPLKEGRPVWSGENLQLYVIPHVKKEIIKKKKLRVCSDRPVNKMALTCSKKSLYGSKFGEPGPMDKME